MQRRMVLFLICATLASTPILGQQSKKIDNRVTQTMSNSPGGIQSNGDVSTPSAKSEELKKSAIIKPPRIISIPQQFLTQFQVASQRTAEARRFVEDSPVWKNYVIVQNQEQTTLVAIMGELNIKPMTDECIPVYLRDGKRTLEDGSPVTSATGKLDHFECPVKEEKKP